jgi:hypothetical protein
MESISYLDALAEWDESSVIGYSGITPKTPYSAFGKAGEHNGVELTVGLMRSLFIVFMETQEDDMQG